VEPSVFDTDMFHVLNSGEMNVFRLRFTVTLGPATMYFACGLISAYPMAGSTPGWLSVFAAHPAFDCNSAPGLNARIFQSDR
jgi:hypothetical protein